MFSLRMAKPFVVYSKCNFISGTMKWGWNLKKYNNVHTMMFSVVQNLKKNP